MAKLRDLIPEVRTHLSGAPETTVLLYLRQAAKQFCKDSLIWEVPIGTLDVQPNVNSRLVYQLYNGHNVKGAWSAGDWAVDDIVTSNGARYLCLVTRTAADTDPPADDAVGWMEVAFVAPAQAYITAIEKVELEVTSDPEPRPLERLAEGLPRPYTFNIKTGELTIRSGAITAAGTLEVFAQLEPTRAATTLPDFLVELWGVGIAEYAIFQMFLMPKQEWTDPALAEIFRDKYKRRVAEATELRAREGTSGGIEVSPIPFV